MDHFLQHFEKLLQFITSIKYETVFFGDFIINTLFDITDSTRYVNLLTAFGFELRKCSPTSITPISKSCLDYAITQNPVLTDTLETTISNRYTVLADLALKQIGQGNENRTPMLTFRKLHNLKKEQGVIFFSY